MDEKKAIVKNFQKAVTEPGIPLTIRMEVIHE